MLESLIEKKGDVEIYVESSGEIEPMQAVTYDGAESDQKIIFTSLNPYQ